MASGGAGGGHRVRFGDRQRISQPVKPSTTRPQSLCAGRAEPEFERIQLEGRKKRRGVEIADTLSRIESQKRGLESPSGSAGTLPDVFGDDQSKAEERGTFAGVASRRRFFLPSDQSGTRNALPTRWVSPGQRAQVVCIYPYAPVLMASVQRERQTGYQIKGQGLVARQADVPAWVGDAQGKWVVSLRRGDEGTDSGSKVR